MHRQIWEGSGWNNWGDDTLKTIEIVDEDIPLGPQAHSSLLGRMLKGSVPVKAQAQSWLGRCRAGQEPTWTGEGQGQP
jgi:hypothetical protein